MQKINQETEPKKREAKMTTKLVPTKKLEKKARDGRDAPIIYNFEEDNQDPDKRYMVGSSLYGTANDYEEARTFEFQAYDTSEQLEQLKKEIKVRVKITKQEIFKIGELLYTAKKLCQQQGTKFQEWIAENFDFSYETANNFMNVYKNCLGHRNIALNIKPSILYKLSAPGFNEDLREFMFEHANLEELTNGKLRELTRKHKEDGFEAIQEDIEELNRGVLIVKQTRYTFDMVESALRTLNNLKEKIESRGINLHKGYFEASLDADEKEAFEINTNLHNAIEYTIEYLDRARMNSEKILKDVDDKIQKRCGVVESDGQIEKRGEEEEDRAELERKGSP